MAKTITISISDVEEKILYDNGITVTKDGVTVAKAVALIRESKCR